MINENWARNKETNYLRDKLARFSTEHLYELEEQLELLYKVIDIMAEDLYRYDDQLDTGKFVDFDDVKEYYFKKARGEENERGRIS